MIEQDKNCRKYLVYDFTFEGQRHRGRILLDEDTPGVQMMYDDHDLEVTWLKRIRHKGKRMVINIVLNDDAYDADEGKVVASAWVSVYALKDRNHLSPIALFEPDGWIYIDEYEVSNSVCKASFYGK